MEKEAFGFRVIRETTGYPKFGETDNWTVELQHQSYSDVISIGSRYGGAPHEDAVAAMERFIAEAQAALEMLRQRVEGETR